jgi:coenzyme F420-reducing hydrogenase delta subunit
MQRVLQFMGLEPERFQARWVSGSEGPRFAEIITRITEDIRALGPNRKLRDDA